ncbi:probable serine/threonine-protein kinase DDB_G0282963 isoform X2 [Wyeomyia smithii]|uniref:probable serine/threonine-protein kinase DDB_G0282963 isoform X2 n=1 Tax=Wyeomyia smithii TaxID=174621 RepID=UPI002467B22E|nr:probable serine/threonine-protein kinase DDB_G0282963 isoform X2 [Wyeomyia smithii]
MVSSTITLDKKSSSSSTSAATATACTAQASAEQSIISIPLNATANSNGTGSDPLNLSEQKISILFPKCKPRSAEHCHLSSSSTSGANHTNNNLINSMSIITSNSKSDITGTSSSLTTPTSLASSSYTFSSKSYGMEPNTFRATVGNSGAGSGYELLGDKSDFSSRMNNNHYESSSRSNARHTMNSVDKYSFYYNNQPPPLSASPTENNANTVGGGSHFLPSDDDDEEEEIHKASSYQRHSYYGGRQSHYYNLPKQDPGTPSSSSRYHWDLSPSSTLPYSAPISSATSTAPKRSSLKPSYTQVLQSPLEDESDVEDRLKYFNYQNEMHNNGPLKTNISDKPSVASGIYCNYKTNEMIVFNDIEEERRRVHQQQQQPPQEISTGAGLRVTATVDELEAGMNMHHSHPHHHHAPLHRHQQQLVTAGDGSGANSSSAVLAGKADDNGAHKAADSLANSGSNIMEYEGSPRRFGLSLNEDSPSYYISSNFKLNLTSPSLLTPPRPGFPQRVIPTTTTSNSSSNNNNNNSSPSADTTPTPTGTANSSHYHLVTRSPTLLEQVSSGLNSSVTFDANALLSEFDAKRAAVSASTTIDVCSNSNSTMAAPVPGLEVNKLNVIRLENDYHQEQQPPTKRSTPESKPTLGLSCTTADDNPTLGAGSFTTPITASSTFDYLYEFSETRKVLEEFFKCPTTEDVEKAFEKFSDYNESGDDVESLDIHYEYPSELDAKAQETTYIRGAGAEHQQQQLTMTPATALTAGRGEQRDQVVLPAAARQSPINNNNSDADGDDDDVVDDDNDGEEDGDENEEEDDEDGDLAGGVGNNLKYMINMKSKPRIKEGYSSFRKKKQEKKAASGGSAVNASPQNVPTGGMNENDNDGEDEEEIDIYSANQHHRSYHQQQRVQQQHQQQQTQEQQQHLRQHAALQQQQQYSGQYQDHEQHFSMYLDPGSRASSCDVINESNLDTTQFMTNGNGKRLKSSGSGSGKKPLNRRQSKNFNYSPDTTDYESNCGDYDSEISLKYGSDFGMIANGGSGVICDDLNNGVITSSSAGVNNSTLPNSDSLGSGQPTLGGGNNYSRYYTSMPVLEDGLSSGHVSDTENNNPIALPTPDLINSSHKLQQVTNSYSLLTSPTSHTVKPASSSPVIAATNHNSNSLEGLYGSNGIRMNGTISGGLNSSTLQNNKIFKNRDPELESLYTINTIQSTPPPPAPAPHRKSSIDCDPQSTLQQMHNQHTSQSDVQAALKDIRTCLQRTKTLASPTQPQSNCTSAQHQQQQQQQTNAKNYDKHSMLPPEKLVDSPVPSISPVWIPRRGDGKLVTLSPTTVNKPGILLPTTPTTGGPTERSTNMATEKDSLLLGSSAKNLSALEDDEDPDTDLETDRLLGHQRLDDQGFYDDNSKSWADRRARSLLHKLSPKQQTGPGAATCGNTMYTGKTNNNQGSLLRQGLSTLLSPTSAVTQPNQPGQTLPEIVTSSKASPALLGSGGNAPSQNSSSLNSSNNSGNLINLNGPNDTGAISPDHSRQTSPNKLDNKTNESTSPNGSNNSKSDTDKKKKGKNKEGKSSCKITIFNDNFMIMLY